MTDKITGIRLWLFHLNRFYCRFWHRLTKDVYQLPEGPLILVGNHRAGVDPLLVQAVINRHVHFLMAREYYQAMWYGRWFFDAAGAIPVNPGGANRHALNEAIENVSQGKALCLFPEGEANPKVPLKRILPGAVVIAMEGGAPILPFRITGTWPFDHENLWHAFVRRGRAKIVFGEMLYPPKGKADKHTIRQWTDAMKKALSELR